MPAVRDRWGSLLLRQADERPAFVDRGRMATMTELDPDEVRRWLDIARHRGQPPSRESIVAADEARKFLTDRTPQFVEDWLRLREENERLLALLRDMERSRPLILGVELRRRLNEILWQA